MDTNFQSNYFILINTVMIFLKALKSNWTGLFMDRITKHRLYDKLCNKYVQGHTRVLSSRHEMICPHWLGLHIAMTNVSSL